MSIQVTLLFIVATINSLLSLFVLLGNRDKTNIVYSIFVVFASFWAIGLGFFIMEPNLNTSLYIADFYYVSALGIPTFFYLFSIIFLNKTYIFSKKQIFIFIPLILTIILFLVDKHTLLKNIILVQWGKDVIINDTNYFIYGLFFILFVVWSYINLYKSYRIRTEPNEKQQLKLILLGTSIGFLFGMIFDLILPFMGNYRYIFIGPLFSLSMVVSIAYAITKYKMFNMKVVVTQMLIIILWISILIRTILAVSLQEQITDGILLLITIIVGIFIIRSILKEVQLREKIERLVKDLERVNASLEQANERLKELDQLKSEFLSLATHQIKAPLTAVKGYASLILEGDYGKITPTIREAVQTIFNSCQNLVVIVGEFLDISRIEQGRMKYDIVDFDGKQLVENSIKELRPNIEKAGLHIEMSIPEGEFKIHADEGKTRQVIGNIIDNAIKYTPTGSVKISIAHAENVIRISVTDSGIGISAEDIPKLFGKFVRAKDANKTNVIGTGLGLYVAKQMVEAQGGKIWVESPGIGKGSTFIVELPEKK